MNQIVKFFLKNKEQLAYFIGTTVDNPKLCKIFFPPFLKRNNFHLMHAFHILINFLVINIILFSFECCGTSENKYQPKAENIKKGEILFKTVGCFVCHSITSEVKYGPALNNILNTRISVIGKSGQYEIIVDREYILRSIKDPAFEKMIEFQNKKMMQATISDEDMNFLTDYIISINLKQEGK